MKSPWDFGPGETWPVYEKTYSAFKQSTGHWGRGFKESALICV